MQAISPREDRYRLAGEPVDSALPDEIEHWRIVYRELLTTIDELLERTPAAAIASPEGSRLQMRREELGRCLEHWTERSPSLRVS